MKFPAKLFSYLTDGRFHSGEVLAQQLGISRTAIWKQIKSLREMGLNIESDKNSGYCLTDNVGLFDQGLIHGALSPDCQAKLDVIETHVVIDSTNARAAVILENCTVKEPIGNFAIFADQQTSGRGRRGRVWVSPFGRSIYGSLVWRFSAGVAALSGLSLVVAVAIVKVLEACGYQGIELKWPNDLLWQRKKLAGILLEMSGDITGECRVVIGFGLNLNISQLEGVAIDQPWTDLYSINPNLHIDKNQLAAALVERLVEELGYFEKQGFQAYISQWQQRDAFLGSDVILASGDQQHIVGRHSGVSDDGSILIQTGLGTRLIVVASLACVVCKLTV